MTTIAVALPLEAIEAIAERAAEIVHERLRAEQDVGSPWLYGAKAAAEYLRWPVGRVYKLTAARVMPAHRVGQRYAYSPATRPGPAVRACSRSYKAEEAAYRVADRMWPHRPTCHGASTPDSGPTRRSESP